MDCLATSVRWENIRNYQSVEMTRRAFHLVEAMELDAAINCLEEAVTQDPLCGDAYNELAYIYSKYKNDPNLSEENIRLAIRCAPDNPKFRNTLLCIGIDRAKSYDRRKLIANFVEEQLFETSKFISNINANYAPLYLSLADLKALGGSSVEAWEIELKNAKRIYLSEGRHAGERTTCVTFSGE
jgi:tetratricopeptide (TPR) repeat protein